MKIGQIKIPDWAEHDALRVIPPDFTGEIELKQTTLEVFQGGVHHVNVTYRIRAPKTDKSKA